jgi:hypothetical protein
MASVANSEFGNSTHWTGWHNCAGCGGDDLRGGWFDRVDCIFPGEILCGAYGKSPFTPRVATLEISCSPLAQKASHLILKSQAATGQPSKNQL